MINRMRANGLAVLFCVSAVLLPSETLGRGGSFGGRGLTVPSVPIGWGFHPPAPQAQLHSHQSGLHDSLRRRFGHRFFRGMRFGDGYYGLDNGGGYFGPGYGALDYIEPHMQPTGAEPETTGTIPVPIPGPGSMRPIVIYRSGCQTQTVTVPSEEGGNRSINVTRCY